MAYIEATLVVPTRPEPGSRISFADYQQRLRLLEQTLTLSLGGFTQVTEQGAWADEANSKVIRERVHVYTLSYNDNDKWARELIDSLPKYVCHAFDQREVYLSRKRIEGKPIHTS